jgi:tetratricopeptide (TPR) repeat protein
MATHGITQSFDATHGSRTRRRDRYTIELLWQGAITGGFVAGIDHKIPGARLTTLIQQLSDQYLDDIVGRATNENIANFILFHLNTQPIHAVRVYEGTSSYVEVTAAEFDAKKFPAQHQYNLGQSWLLRENPGRASSHATAAIDLRPEFAEAYVLRGRCKKYQHGYDAALDDFKKATELEVELGEAWRNLGNAHLALNHREEMIVAFDKCVSLMPSSALAINNRGYAHYTIGDYDAALADHDYALKLDPNYAEAHFDRSMTLSSLGRAADAESALRESQRLKDKHTDTYTDVKMY